MARVWLFLKETGRACAAALQFLTIAAPLLRRPFSQRELGAAVGWFPLVGLALGGLLAGADLLLSALWHGSGLQIALILTLWVVLTGALHVDGFLDTCDGLFGGRSPEQRLEIMRDPHVGSFAVVGGVLLMLLKWNALWTAHDRTIALLLAPTLGRWCIAWALVSYPYARAEGLGRALKDHAGARQLILATLFAGLTLGCACVWAGPWVLAAAAAAFVGAWLLSRWARARIPGLTGDVYGAICEVSELIVLVASS